MNALPMEIAASVMDRETGITFRLGDVTWSYWDIRGERLEWRSSCQRFRVWREGHRFFGSCDGRPSPSQRTLRAAMVFAQSDGILRDHGFRNWEAFPTQPTTQSNSYRI
jgi:hypothetical protein